MTLGSSTPSSVDTSAVATSHHDTRSDEVVSQKDGR